MEESDDPYFTAAPEGFREAYNAWLEEQESAASANPELISPVLPPIVRALLP